MSRQTRLTGGGGKGTRLTSLSLIRHSKANMEKRNIFERVLFNVYTSEIKFNFDGKYSNFANKKQ